MLPLIGITANFDSISDKHYLTDYYVQAVVAAGGVPLILPLVKRSISEEIYQIVDGIIFSGGGDLDPRFFGQNPQKGIEEICPLRDSFEIQLAQRFLKGEKPVLGICRGMQVLNIAAGGDIYQDINEITNQEHSQNAPKWHSFHSVNIARDTVLFKIIGEEKIYVNSFHHQAVNKLGRGLSPTAASEDGLSEALESVEPSQFVLGVQWHPECLWNKEKHAFFIFKNLIKEALNRKEKKLMISVSTEKS